MKRIALAMLFLYTIVCLYACTNATSLSATGGNPKTNPGSPGILEDMDYLNNVPEQTPTPEPSTTPDPEEISKAYEELKTSEHCQLINEINGEKRFDLNDIEFSDLSLSYNGFNDDEPTTRRAVVSKFGKPIEEQKEWVEMLHRETPILLYRFATFVFDGEGDDASLIEVRIIAESEKISGPRDFVVGDELKEVIKSFAGEKGVNSPHGFSEIYEEDNYFACKYSDNVARYQRVYFCYNIPGRNDNLSAELSFSAKNNVVDNIVISLTNSPTYME